MGKFLAIGSGIYAALLRDNSVRLFQLVNVPCFHAHIKKMAGHGLFNYLFTPVAEAVKANIEIIFIFGNYVKILNLACPALYTVTLHTVPPSLNLYYSIFIIGRIKRKVK